MPGILPLAYRPHLCEASPHHPARQAQGCPRHLGGLPVWTTGRHVTLVHSHCKAPPLAALSAGAPSPSPSIDVLSTGQSESVRDVQFSIRDYFTFASTFENGNVQLWDIRRPDRCERMFTAHNGPVFCCDWHPEDRCGVGWGHRQQGGMGGLMGGLPPDL